MSPIPKFNRLGQEKSPYLLQHKDNPVHWFPWGEEAFQAAREENKIIFLSVGYSTCYWCHMMEKDSFEKPEVAAVMNELFINVKVDREEHPDVDQIYMDAVMGMTGRGGWPMSVFLTPELEPFFGGTFFWKDQFIHILRRIHEEWTKNPDNIREFGRQVVSALSGEETRPAGGAVSEEFLKQAYHALARRFDPAYGGFGPAPKFPHASDIAVLLRVHARTGDAKALTMATKTLDEMARGGIYDHVGGGFHRYSTDARWLVPHFEKMLYDNAQLAVAYLEGWRLTKNRLYAEVARQTLDYVIREMRDPEGGFYSAQDAGEVGKEGEFYVWTWDELKATLDAEELHLVRQLYGAAESGNWEHGKNILHVPSQELWESALTREARLVREKLFAARDRRAYPHKDDKILTSWNGLMIGAMAEGFQVLEDKKYLVAAQESALFIQQTLFKEGRLLRRYRGNESRFAATLDDYAYLVDGLIRLFQSDFDDRWLAWAEELQAAQDAHFWDENGGGYFFAAKDEKNLVIRKKEFHDSSIPSGNAVSVLNLLRLAGLTMNPGYHERANAMLSLYAAKLKERAPLGFGTALLAIDFATDDHKEIAVIGNVEDAGTTRVRQAVYQSFLPNAVFAVGGVGASTSAPLIKDKSLIGDDTTVYVCRGHACQRPTTDLAEVEKQLLERKMYGLS